MTVHVAYCFDKNYQQHFGASVTSLLLNFSGSGEDLVIHVVTDDADPVFTRRLDQLRDVFKARIELHQLRTSDIAAFAHLAGTYRAAHIIGTTSYFRLLLPNILSESVDKVLYLDADTVVLADARELFDAEIAGAPVAGVADAAAQHWASKHKISRYINSGVLLMDLQQWRKSDYVAHCISFASQNPEKLIHGEQCAVNLVFQDQLHLLDGRWNYYVTPKLDAQTPGNAAILHFITGDKPWHAWYENGMGRYYWRYLDVSPWAGALPVPPSTFEEAHRMARLLRKQGKVYESVGIYENMIASFAKPRKPRT